MNLFETLLLCIQDDISSEEPNAMEKHKAMYGPVFLSLCQVLFIICFLIMCILIYYFTTIWINKICIKHPLKADFKNSDNLFTVGVYEEGAVSTRKYLAGIFYRWEIEEILNFSTSFCKIIILNSVRVNLVSFVC